jgi:hypothetical protein
MSPGYVTHLLIQAVWESHPYALPADEVELVKTGLRDLGYLE